MRLVGQWSQTGYFHQEGSEDDHNPEVMSDASDVVCLNLDDDFELTQHDEHQNTTLDTQTPRLSNASENKPATLNTTSIAPLNPQYNKSKDSAGAVPP